MILLIIGPCSPLSSCGFSEAYEIRSNSETGYGRADILMIPKTKEYPLAFIIEFKSLKDNEDLKQHAEDALAQIEEKNYQAQLLAAGITQDNIRKLGIAVKGKHVTVLAE